MFRQISFIIVLIVLIIGEYKLIYQQINYDKIDYTGNLILIILGLYAIGICTVELFKKAK